MNLRQRKENTKPIKKKVLIVCEGARTEPNYFKSFRVYKDCHIVGSGSNTLSVVKEAIRLKKKTPTPKLGACSIEILSPQAG